MEHRRKADLSILARDLLSKADFGVLARHAAPEPAVNAPLLAKNAATRPMMRARDRYGVDDTTERLHTPQLNDGELKDSSYGKVERITVKTYHYASRARRLQQQYAVKRFSTSKSPQKELFASEIAALNALSVKDAFGADEIRYATEDPLTESFSEISGPAERDVGHSENETKGSSTVKLRDNPQKTLGTNDRHASKSRANDPAVREDIIAEKAAASSTSQASNSLESEKWARVKRKANERAHLLRQAAATRALGNAAAIMKPKTAQTPAESDECAMYITYTISEDRSGTVDEVMGQRLAALTDRHGTNKARKKKPRRKNAWGELEPESSADEMQSRSFRCDECLQSFARNHDLKRHKRIHLAVKPFPCAHCDKSFSRKDALKVSTHLRASSFAY
jgi:hypothetical protein